MINALSLSQSLLLHATSRVAVLQAKPVEGATKYGVDLNPTSKRTSLFPPVPPLVAGAPLGAHTTDRPSAAPPIWDFLKPIP